MYDGQCVAFMTAFKGIPGTTSPSEIVISEQRIMWIVGMPATRSHLRLNVTKWPHLFVNISGGNLFTSTTATRSHPPKLTNEQGALDVQPNCVPFEENLRTQECRKPFEIKGSGGLEIGLMF